MKYGEIQAVVQLAVGLNVGIFALTELSLPYIKKQKKHLEGTLKSILRAERSINNNEDHQTREALRGRLAIEDEKFTSHSVKTENDW
jgi:hypothetical protein